MGMTREQILEILENYKLRIPPTVFYELKADIVNFEEPTTKNNLAVDCMSSKIAKEMNLEVANMKKIVQALSSVTSTNRECVDCISRADALRVAKNEYLRGWHNALCKALSEKYSIHCEEGNFSVIQEETITGLGLSMNCALGKDAESYMSTMPSVTPQEPKTRHWIKIKPYPLQMHNYECSECGHETDDNTENYCSECGAKMESEG